MHLLMIAAPVTLVVAAMPRLGAWARRYFEAALWPTCLDEGR